jgi:ADP-heptose:LPS heptosyltransferase
LILWLPDCRYQELDKSEARLTLDDILHALDHQPGWQLREADLIDGHIYVVWQKRDDERQIKTPWRKQPRHILVARTGAHGDALMASSVLPWLKEQGWAISFITKCPGIETLRHDPHIDELIMIADGQVPDEEFPYYWQAWENRFDRFINLTYSVEGELLKQPSRPDYFWSDEQRRANCGRSYLRYTHNLAGVPGPYRVCFYPDEGEKIWAQAKAAQYGKFVLWCLRGSADHKWWPYGPQAICRLLAKTDLHFVLTGDTSALPLANDILDAVKNYRGDEKRVHSLVNQKSIRAVMALAHHATVVVGPETGVLNAVSLQPVPKVLLLSHSAPSNLSDDWCAATALKPTSPCYPCHRLHYGHEWCPRDETTGAAVCASSISVEEMVSVVMIASQQNKSSPWWLRSENLELMA